MGKALNILLTGIFLLSGCAKQKGYTKIDDDKVRLIKLAGKVVVVDVIKPSGRKIAYFDYYDLNPGKIEEMTTYHKKEGMKTYKYPIDKEILEEGQKEFDRYLEILTEIENQN